MDIRSLTPASAARGPLAGIGVLVTRPAKQAAAFAQKIGALGAAPVIYPAIVILPPAERTRLDEVHANLANFDLAFFVSINAVEYGVPERGRWPRGLVAFAPGPGTAEALAAAGVPNVRIPVASFDSEGVLALPELADVRGRRGIVFRGEGGRDLLTDTLRARGAHIDEVSCYRRAPPSSAADGLIEALREDRIDAVTITSSEGLDNLWSVIGDEGRALLGKLPMFAPHSRIVARGRGLGLSVIETSGGDAGLIAGLLKWASSR